MKIIGSKYITNIEYNKLEIIPREDYEGEDTLYSKITLYCYTDNMNLDSITTIISVINDKLQFEAMQLSDAIYDKVSLSIRKLLDNSTIHFIIRNHSNEVLVDIYDEILKYDLEGGI